MRGGVLVIRPSVVWALALLIAAASITAAHLPGTPIYPVAMPHAVALDDVGAELGGVARRTVEPWSLGLWLRGARR